MPKLQLKDKRFLCRFFDPVLYDAYPYKAADDAVIERMFFDESLENVVPRVVAYARSIGLMPFDICEVVYEFDVEEM